MLVGESTEVNLLGGESVPDGVPLSIEGKPTPDDFVDAQCIDMHSVREPCKLKVDRLHQTIGVWTPPGRESSSFSIYQGSGLEAGCVPQNPDHGYPENIRSTTKVVS